MYPQSDGGLAIVNIDASRGFIAQWVHLFVVIEGIHRNGYRRKRYLFCFDLVQTYISFAIGMSFY